jgi:hypothetical protein
MNAHEILLEAELFAFDMTNEEQERFNELQRELQDPAYLEDVETDLYTREMLPSIPISDAVRKACTEDMQLGAKNNWRTL